MVFVAFIVGLQHLDLHLLGTLILVKMAVHVFCKDFKKIFKLANVPVYLLFNDPIDCFRTILNFPAAYSFELGLAVRFYAA